MSDFNQKQSLSEFSDRELLLLILSNQVNIYREIEYLKTQLQTGENKGLGPYLGSFKDLVTKSRGVLQQADVYLKQDDTDKGFLKL